MGRMLNPFIPALSGVRFEAGKKKQLVNHLDYLDRILLTKMGCSHAALRIYGTNQMRMTISFPFGGVFGNRPNWLIRIQANRGLIGPAL